MIPVLDLLPWRRALPPPPPGRVPPPAKPVQLAEEVTDLRRPVGLDLLVFGDWPGTYARWAGDA